MSIWLKKNKYNSNLKSIILNNSFFFFWDFDNKSSQKEFLLFLEKLNVFTFWLKRGVFRNYNRNHKLSDILKSQSNFSYCNYNSIDLKLFVNLLDDNKENLIILGMLIDKNLFIDYNRFEKVKKELSFLQNPQSHYKSLLLRTFSYYTLNRLFTLRILYFQLYKKNFSSVVK